MISYASVYVQNLVSQHEGCWVKDRVLDDMNSSADQRVDWKYVNSHWVGKMIVGEPEAALQLYIKIASDRLTCI